MDLVPSSQGKMVIEVAEAIKSELDGHNTGGRYNTTYLMEFPGCIPTRQLNKSIALRARLQRWTYVKRGGTFLSCDLFTLGVANSKEKRVSTLKLLQTCNFSHLKYGGQKFRYLQNLTTLVERAAIMKITWRSNGWVGVALVMMVGSVKDLFVLMHKQV
eukprot:15366507-Ditylum_brightwellii.AAC.1